MIRAMWTAASGMVAQQSNLDNISNNLANANTNGYKKTSTEFQSLLYANMAGTNRINANGQALPINYQIGLGVKVAGMRQDYSQGNLTQTGNPLDMALIDRGFFEVRLPDGSSAYTRDGGFKVDGEGRIVNSSGYELAITSDNDVFVDDLDNFTVANDGSVAMKRVSPLKIDIYQVADAGLPQAIPGMEGFYAGDLEQWTPEEPPNDVPPADRYYRVQLPDGVELPDGVDGDVYVKADNFTVDADGNIVTMIKVADEENNFLPAILETSEPPEVEYGKTLEILINSDGAFELSEVVGKVNVVDFVNPEGLERLGENLYRQTSASGGARQLDSADVLRSGFIEGSNVQVAEEMVKMIMAQRVYELNSKAITTSDEMMGIANNLKR